MDAKAVDLRSLINAPKQFLIPVFQRYYSWKLENWQQLWDDIETLFDENGQPQSHFMGSLVFIPVLPIPIQGNPQYQVIDGQQRLMTLSLLLCALRYHARQFEQHSLEAELHRHYMVHEFGVGHEQYRIYPRLRDRNQFLLATDDPTAQIDGQVGEALSFFKESIGKFIAPDPPERLRNLFEYIKARLEFVYIQLDAENPYEIFKSLNSTGVPLSEADLIRNFVFMHIDVFEQDRFDDTHWRPLEAHFEYKSGDRIGELNVNLATRFFRDFLMQSGDYVRSDAVFATFEKRYKDRFSPRQLAEKLKKNAEFYDILRGISPHPTASVEKSLAKVHKLDTSTAYPLLLVLLHLADEGKISNAELSQGIELIAGFVLRRYATSQSSRAYGRWFVIACRELKKQPLHNLDKYLREKGFPSDKQFQAGFATFPWYIRSYTNVILEALERHIPHKEAADLKNASIEHIMPHTLSDAWRTVLGPEAERIHEEWLHTIGNLTLSAYNPELQNHPFAVKREEYARSNIQLNRRLAKHEQWAETEIRERGLQLAAVASQIWRGSLGLEPEPDKVETAVRDDNGDGLTETQQLQLDYWTAFMQYLEAQGSVVNTRKPQPQNWSDFAIGRSNFNLTTFVNTVKKLIGVQLAIWGPDAKTYYKLLLSDRDAIEKELGTQNTEWSELPDKISSYVAITNSQFDPWDRKEWPQQHAWLHKWLDTFHQVLAPRVKQLEIPERIVADFT
jgi:hypothetical protein